MNKQFGADYYPEHWPEERWEKDARLMQEMGLDVVRMAEFAWTRIEPREGEFDFSWLDRAIDLLGQYGIKTILSTPTPTPPAWIIEKHKDILPIDSSGVVTSFGGRHHNCQSNKNYRAHAVRMIEALTHHYKDNPHVIAWQTDNEFGNSHNDLCHCSSCRASFQDWLRGKYGTVEELNTRWGTVFWSQEYDTFTQIPTPMTLVTAHNPSLLLDWKRFHSNLICSFQQFQIDIIRKNCPSHEITHNLMGFADLVDYFDLSENLDFISHDQYPSLFRKDHAGTNHSVAASALDLMRGIKGQTFCIMEQQSGPAGWTIMGNTPEPGQLALWTAQSIARGADCIVFFRWRTCTVGTEQYWHGILPHSGNPGRRYQELKETITQLKPVMKEFKGALSGAEAAILYDYNQNWALEIQPHHPDMDYIEQVQVYYDAFHKRQIPLDFVSQKQDLSSYKLIVAPLLYLMTPEIEKKLSNYVKDGGHLLLTMRTGVKNDDNVCMSDRELPGKLGDLLGVEILEYDCLREMTRTINWQESDDSFQGEKWCDLISLKGAKALANISDGWYADSPIITENTAEKGKAYYVGTEPDRGLTLKIIDHLIGQTRIEPLAIADESLEVVRRHMDDQDFYFVLNHGKKELSFQAPDNWQKVIGKEKIPSYGYNVYKKMNRSKE